MLFSLLRLWTELVGRLGYRRRCGTNVLRTPVRQLERLEERLTLSSYAGPGEVPLACCCPGCQRAESVYQGQSVPADAYRTVTQWAQPGGPGTPLTIPFSFTSAFNKPLGTLSVAQKRTAIVEALSRWAAVAPLRFVEVPDGSVTPGTGPLLRFTEGAVDGAYGVLAYAYYPGYYAQAGQIFFDTAERWTLHPATGIDFTEVALHEIGHALGLGHQNPPAQGGVQAIMNPIYAGLFRGPGTSFLLADDIAGIRALYGAGVGSVTTIGSPAPPSPPTGSTFIVSGTTLTVRGTPGADIILCDLHLGVVSVNGVRYTGSLNSIRTIVLNGEAGDRLQLTGSANAENVDVSATRVTLTGTRWSVTANGFARVEVVGGAGDRATLRAVAGSNTLTAGPGSTRLVAGSTDLWIRQIPTVTVLGSGTGVATLTDSTGNDTLTVRPGNVTLTGTSYSLSVGGFTQFQTRATRGIDFVQIHATSGVNTVNLWPGRFQFISGKTFSVNGEGFRLVNAISTTKGDVANLYGSTGNDFLVATASSTVLYGTGFTNVVSGFRRVLVMSQGGNDQATFFAGAGTTTVSGSGTMVSVAYSTSTVQFSGFSRATMDGTTGTRNLKRLNGSLQLRVDWLGVWI